MTRTQSRVELYAAIRRDARAGMSEREIQRTHHVGWRTIKAALGSACPAERATYTAIIDRLTFGGNILETGTDSYRLAHTQARLNQPAPI